MQAERFLFLPAQLLERLRKADINRGSMAIRQKRPRAGTKVVVESQTFKTCNISRVQPKTTRTCHLPEIACVVDTRLDRLPQPHLVGNHSTPLFLQDKFNALLLERSKRFPYTFRHLTAPDTSTTKDKRGNDATHRMDDPHPTTHIRERRPSSYYPNRFAYPCRLKHGSISSQKWKAD